MRKEYIVPELETVKFGLKEVILSSLPTEETLPEVIGGDDDGGTIGGDF